MTNPDLGPSALHDDDEPAPQRPPSFTAATADAFVREFGSMSALRYTRAGEWVLPPATPVPVAKAEGHISRKLARWLEYMHQITAKPTEAVKYIGLATGPRNRHVLSLAIESIQGVYIHEPSEDDKYTLRTAGWGVRLDAFAEALESAEDVWDPDTWSSEAHDAFLEPDASVPMHTAAAFSPASPAAHPAVWDAFVRSVCGGDPAMVRHLQQLAGYVLTADVEREPQLTFFYGTGGNGKTTFIESLQRLLGVGETGYAAVLPVSVFDHKRGGGPSPDRLRVRGKRLVTLEELPDNKPLASSAIKNLTGGGTISGRLLYSNTIEQVLPVCKIFSMSNYLPVLHASDEGTWRRLAIVPFTERFPQGKRDEDLKDVKLPREMDGILLWAIEGFVSWWKGGRKIAVCPKAEAAFRQLQTDNGLHAQFLAEECVVDPEAKVPVGDYMERFKRFLKGRGCAVALTYPGLKELVLAETLLAWDSRGKKAFVRGVRFGE